ncbi:MAG TPA: hypothetical protein VF695_03995 [Sphingomonas sp.]|jgi:hypothetical protein
MREVTSGPHREFNLNAFSNRLDHLGTERHAGMNREAGMHLITMALIL